jgi:DNA-binding LacI/PurR family transcriptional regulator
MNAVNRRVTRADVAKEANVSETIVSYVVNNNRYVAQDKRERVEDAIEKLNYKPNNVARALKGKKSNQLLFIADQITNEYFSRIVSSMDKYAYASGFLISLCANRNTQEFVSQVISRQYDGIIISSTSFPLEYVESFSRAGIPVIMFEHRRHGKLPDNVASLSAGLYQGAKAGVDHLAERGKRNIIYIDRISKRGHVSGPTDLRLSGYMDEMHAHGLKADQSTVISGCHTEEELKDTVTDYVKKHPETDGIIGRNDIDACIAMQAVKDFGKKVPQEIGVVGFDNSSISRFCSPKMTTLEMQMEEISKCAVDMILKMMAGEKPEAASFETKLIVREST